MNVHNTVVLLVNRIDDANKKRNYINAYIRKIRDESFMARGVTSYKKKNNKKTNKKKKNNKKTNKRRR